MAEQPTQEQKTAAAREVVSVDRMADETLTDLLNVIWSQLALVPSAVAGDPSLLARPLFFQAQTTDDLGLQEEIKAHNEQGVALGARVSASNLAKPKS